MKLFHIPFIALIALFITGCTDDDTALYTTYKGYFTEMEGGMIYDFFQEPDTVVLILNASKVPCDSTETVEEVPCGDSPIYMGKTYILSISDTRAILTIGSASHKYDYVADKRTRKWSYRPGEYDIHLTGYEDYKMMANVHKAVISRDNLTFDTKIAFFRKNGDKEELAFVSYGVRSHIKYGPKRSKKMDFPATIEEHDMVVSKDDEYNWILSDKDAEYRFNILERQLIQTKPVYQNIGSLSFTN